MIWFSIPVSLMLTVLLQVPGCTTVHVRKLTWPSVTARQECGWWLLPMPKTVWFNNVGISMKGKPAAFTLKMPNGDVIESTDLTREKLKPYFSSVGPLGEDYAPETEHAEIRFDNGSVYVHFVGERVTRIRVGSWFRQRLKGGGTCATIGDADGKRFLSFPASEQQLVDFLGKPTTTETYLFDT